MASPVASKPQVPSAKMPTQPTKTQKRNDRRDAALRAKIDELSQKNAALKAEIEVLRRGQATLDAVLLAATDSQKPMASPLASDEKLLQVSVILSAKTTSPEKLSPPASTPTIFNKEKFEALVKIADDINTLRNKAKMLYSMSGTFEAEWVYEKAQKQIETFNKCKECANGWFKDYWSSATTQYKAIKDPDKQLVHQYNEHQMYYDNMKLRFIDATRELNPLVAYLNKQYDGAWLFGGKPKFTALESVTAPVLT